MNNLLDMAAMEPEALSLMMGEPEGNVNTLRQVTGRKKRAKSITAQDYLNAMRSRDRGRMTHNFSGSGMPGTFDQSPMMNAGRAVKETMWDNLNTAQKAGYLPGPAGVVSGAAGDVQELVQNPESRTPTNMSLMAGGNALAAMSGGIIPAAMVKAFHGTPHKVDKFKMDKIGTGEGAQAYGHGLYFAENPDVAGEYQKMAPQVNPSPRRTFKGQELEAGSPEYHAATLMEHGDSLAKKRFEVDGWIKDWAEKGRPSDAHEVVGWRKTLDILNEAESKKDFGMLKHEGNLYNVNLDVNPEDLLDWDAPLSEQPQKIRELFADSMREGYLPEKEYSKIYEDLGYTDKEQLKALYEGYKKTPLENVSERGSDLYSNLVKKYGSQAKVSEALRAAGIPGIQYYDGMSRTKMNHVPVTKARKALITSRMDEIQRRGAQSADEMNELQALSKELAEADAAPRTRNYVMFDEDLIDITNPSSLNDLVKPQGLANKPTSVYQGRSKKGLGNFFNPEGVSWGTTDKETAELFAGRMESSYPYANPPRTEVNYTGQVYDLDFDIKNPMEVDIKDTLWNREKELKMITQAKEKGFDGLAIKHGGGKVDYVAFDKSQVTKRK